MIPLPPEHGLSHTALVLYVMTRPTLVAHATVNTTHTTAPLHLAMRRMREGRGMVLFTEAAAPARPSTSSTPPAAGDRSRERSQADEHRGQDTGAAEAENANSWRFGGACLWILNRLNHLKSRGESR